MEAPSSLESLRELERRAVGRQPEGPLGWRFEALAGRLVELSGGPGSAALTLAFRLVLQAQRLGEPAAWITQPGAVFFPPDAARSGVDLEALGVVRVPQAALVPKAAEPLLRSGAFGLLVLDLGQEGRLPIAALSRLVGLAQRHHALVLFLTEKPADSASLGSLVSLRAEAVRVGQDGELFECEVRVLKDKRNGLGWRHREMCRAPDGLS